MFVSEIDIKRHRAEALAARDHRTVVLCSIALGWTDHTGGEQARARIEIEDAIRMARCTVRVAA